MTMEHLLNHHHHGGRLGDMIAGWVAHAAIWDLIRHLPLPVVILVGIVAIGAMWFGRRSARKTR